MAKLYPKIEDIKKLKVAPTSGELFLLNFLNNNLSDDYEIFFQPLLNGDNPDIVLLRKNSGAMIIEVKDWHLDHYRLDPYKNWELKIDGTKLKSPISQVINYKNNLYELHIDTLLEKNIKNPKIFTVVTCAVFFHNANVKELEYFLKNGFQNDSKYLKFLSYIELLERDSLNEKNLKSILHSRFLDRDSKFFDDTLYSSFKRYLMPPFHYENEGIAINYMDKQKDLIDSKDGVFKLKGIAGSGKTFVLAKRAVNAHIRTKLPVLILTFNITLKNYIHDRISQIRETFNWSNFYITNYHVFITTQMNNCGIPMVIPDNFENWTHDQRSQYFEQFYSNENLFENVKNNIKKYRNIIIDEVQDYETSWIRIIRKYFLEQPGELVVCGDEKQNIYERTLDNKLPNTTIRGQWNILNKTFRFTTNIANLATLFQKRFFAEKYYLDDFELIEQQNLEDQTNIIEYYMVDDDSIEKIYERLSTIIKTLYLHPNDICILGNNVEIIREIDYKLRKEIKQKTKTMCETKEMFDYLKVQYKENPNKFEYQIENIRKNKKFNFWMNCGLTKLSTIHSFKGWEIHTLVLIIDDNSIQDNYINSELIYTGITRCRKNLIILNTNKNIYHDFFQQNIEKVF